MDFTSTMHANSIRLSTLSSHLNISRHGARILGCTLGNRPVMYCNPDNIKRSTHPCGPNFGALSMRSLKDGKYMMDNAERILPQHGILRDSLFRNIISDETSLSLTLGHYPSNPSFDSYPAEGCFVYSFNLSPDGRSFMQRLSFVNQSSKTVPVDLAVHAYFPWVPGLTVAGLERSPFIDDIAPESPAMVEPS